MNIDLFEAIIMYHVKGRKEGWKEGSGCEVI